MTKIEEHKISFSRKFEYYYEINDSSRFENRFLSISFASVLSSCILYRSLFYSDLKLIFLSSNKSNMVYFSLSVCLFVPKDLTNRGTGKVLLHNKASHRSGKGFKNYFENYIPTLPSPLEKITTQIFLLLEGWKYPPPKYFKKAFLDIYV